MVRGGRLQFEIELKHQIKESRRLLTLKNEKLHTAVVRIKEILRVRERVLSELRSLVTTTTTVDSTVEKHLKDHGYLTRKIEDLKRMESLQGDVNRAEEAITTVPSDSK